MQELINACEEASLEECVGDDGEELSALFDETFEAMAMETESHDDLILPELESDEFCL